MDLHFVSCQLLWVMPLVWRIFHSIGDCEYESIVPSFYFTKLFGQIYDSNSVTIQDLNDANSNTFVCT